MPHSVVRLYTESGPLVGMLREREDEVRDLMTSIPALALQLRIEVDEPRRGNMTKRMYFDRLFLDVRELA
jgi:hypothetical protein